MIFGVDPLLDGGIGWPEIQVVLLKVVLAFALLMISVMFMVWFERKIHADMTNRVGPNRAGPFGLLQTLADGIKLFFKEDLIPDKADRKVFLLAPYLSLIPAFLIFTVVPVGGDFTDHREARRRRHPRPGHAPADRRSRHRHPLRAGHELGRRLRRDARRLGLGIEVSAARFGPRLGADGELRGRARSVGRCRRADDRHALDPRHGDRAGRRRLRRDSSRTGT